MESISFKLDGFEGPLDLLLHLISKHKLNIYDIEISKLLEQYLLYIEEAKEQDLEIAGEFLEMAARLIYIKTVSLLPKPEEAEKVKQELQGALIEYSLCKKAAKRLRENYLGNDIFVREPMKIKLGGEYKLKHSPQSLVEAYLAMNVKKVDTKEESQKKIGAVVEQKVVPVSVKMVYVLTSLYTTGRASISGLFEGMTGRSERVATFLAILDLTKSGRILISDDNMTIYFKRKDEEVGAE